MNPKKHACFSIDPIALTGIRAVFAICMPQFFLSFHLRPAQLEANLKANATMARMLAFSMLLLLEPARTDSPTELDFDQARRAAEWAWKKQRLVVLPGRCMRLHCGDLPYKPLL